MIIAGVSFTEMAYPCLNLLSRFATILLLRDGSLDNILNEFVKAIMKIGGTNVAPLSEQLSFLRGAHNPW